MNKKQLRAARLLRQQQLVDAAKKENRELTAEEQAQFDACQREIDKLTREIEAEERAQSGDNTRQLKTFGKQFTLSRQTFINDDIGLVTSIPARYAAAARRTINTACYEMLMKNTVIYDGKSLFHKDHKNLLKTGTGITNAAL